MIPERITKYLTDKGIKFTRRPHRREVPAQKVAQSIHETGYHVAKSVVVESDHEKWIAVVPAPAMVDTDRVAEMLGKSSARLLEEDEFEGMFPDCELGAEPPFGNLYGLRVVMDESLTHQEHLVVRAGTHDEALELSTFDFMRLEHPRVGNIALLPEKQAYPVQPDVQAPA